MLPSLIVIEDDALSSPEKSTSVIIDFAYLANSSLQNNDEPERRLNVNCLIPLCVDRTSCHVSPALDSSTGSR